MWPRSCPLKSALSGDRLWSGVNGGGRGGSIDAPEIAHDMKPGHLFSEQGSDNLDHLSCRKTVRLVDGPEPTLD